VALRNSSAIEKFGNASRVSKVILLFANALFVFWHPVFGQTAFGDQRPRVLMDTEVGTESSLGYKFPAIVLGSSSEIPLGNLFEVQSSVTYSPTAKYITNNGQRFGASGSALAFINQRVGLVASLEHRSLWTSEFDKKVWFPSAGVVLRNDYFGRGRLYLTYVFPTGCVWATPGNPCQIQSNRLQGITARQDVRSGSFTRWGFETGLYHFCNQGNPTDPQAGRACRWGAVGMATFHFEFHCGSKSPLAPAGAAGSDNF
jgi:hypothetical protein